MPRLAVSMDESQYAWVESQAESRDVSMATVVRRLIDVGRADESVLNHESNHESRSESSGESGNESPAVHDRLDELEERLADLEPRANLHEASEVDTGGDVRVPSETPQASTEDAGDGEGDTSDRNDDHTQADSGGSEAVQALDLPGSGEVLEARRATIDKMYSLLREREGETVATGELKALVDPDRAGYSSVESFWSNALKGDSHQGRPNALTALPGVRELGNGRYQFRAEGG